jgi:hypothetical protein
MPRISLTVPLLLVASTSGMPSLLYSTRLNLTQLSQLGFSV